MRLSRFFICIFFFLVCTPVYSRAAPHSLTVGVNLPLTGDVAEYGVAVKNGIELAREEHPVLLESVRLIYDDNRYDGKSALSVFHKHDSRDKVTLSFVWGDTPSLAVAPVAEKLKKPIVALLTDPAKVKSFDYVIRFISSRYQITDALIKHFRAKNIANVALVYAHNPYNTNYKDSLVQSLTSPGNVEILGDFQPEDMNFKVAILKAKSKKYDALGLYLLPSQVRSFAKQANALQFRMPLFGMDVFQSQQTIEESGGFLENALFATNLVTDSFERRYVSRYKDNSHLIYAANGYEFALTMAALSKLLNKNSSEESVIASLESLPDREGVMGTYGFRNTARDGKHFQFPVVVKQIKNDDVVTLKD